MSTSNPILTSSDKLTLLGLAHAIRSEARCSGDFGRWYSDGMCHVAGRIESAVATGASVSHAVDESQGLMYAQGQRLALSLLEKLPEKLGQ